MGDACRPRSSIQYHGPSPAWGRYRVTSLGHFSLLPSIYAPSTTLPAAGICNHLSAVVPGQPDQFLLIAYGLGWQEVTPDNLLKCRANRDGNFEVIEGNGTADKVSKQLGCWCKCKLRTDSETKGI